MEDKPQAIPRQRQSSLEPKRLKEQPSGHRRANVPKPVAQLSQMSRLFEPPPPQLGGANSGALVIPGGRRGAQLPQVLTPPNLPSAGGKRWGRRSKQPGTSRLARSSERLPHSHAPLAWGAAGRRGGRLPTRFCGNSHGVEGKRAPGSDCFFPQNSYEFFILLPDIFKLI